MISLYIAGRSPLHRLPAGIKLTALMAISIALYPIDQPLWLLPVLLLTVVGYASLGAGGLQRLTLVKPILPILALILIFQTWTQGWAAGLVLLQRLLILVLLANLVTLTTSMDAMMAAVMPLLRPLRWVGIAPHRIAFAVALLVRFVPVLMALTASLLDAWRTRGGGRQQWRLAVPLLINAIRMSDHIAEALAARGGIPNDSKR
ncbi:energy-coupling factor transporter transmembrane component T family protein [Saccharospirillum mangrovi]|uniref:energy-coupling factor transporter transmembrane component T family protein n=1 Tax=Saccharospirillum mangrovi TaxID=2161747 RepID=UPI000D382906|nr:energy-coupling factor transporter transmembrane protein EcfT [Saccharospirillum mangrovi]